MAVRWPKEPKEQFDLFDTWARQVNRFLLAMRSSYRLMAVIRLRIMWKTGEIVATNRMLADDAGGWDEKTIQRDITLLRSAGFLSAAYGGRKNSDGSLVKTRILRLAFPETVATPTGPRMSGRGGGQPDKRGPPQPDKRGPIYSCTPEQEEPTDGPF